ncbi:hypothetical protein BJ085DRAFT_35097 [Dimargaris cristalligena]|uniref:Uncharacterized protein n=1 Tax=Dimargaris cristalligena TaxID=215637 RepID=A0A4V1J4M8_9FUNG|nr:hypothetical protein BJ085DRAFT_35097 [Dimargaris cristalligena]|eukprot:RKP36109.1 hypothetical protein BJ085DRAFT_35097 [Dimargaris cristalligena]
MSAYYTISTSAHRTYTHVPVDPSIRYQVYCKHLKRLLRRVPGIVACSRRSGIPDLAEVPPLDDSQMMVVAFMLDMATDTIEVLARRYDDDQAARNPGNSRQAAYHDLLQAVEERRARARYYLVQGQAASRKFGKFIRWVDTMEFILSRHILA